MSMPPDFDISSTDGLYPIRHVCAETGINPVTLRAWERRYGLIQPVRTPKGHRLYSAEDIDKIQRILTLIEEGVAVSQIGRLFAMPDACEFPPEFPCSRTKQSLEHSPATGEPDAIATPEQIAEPTRDYPAVLPSNAPEVHPVTPAASPALHQRCPAANQEATPEYIPPHTRDPISETLISATDAFNVAHLERTYARLLMRHGWVGVHECAFLRAYMCLRHESQHDPAAEARLAVFAAWATASLSEQLRSALLLCEGSTCPCITFGQGHQRLEGLLFQVACARQGLRVLPLLDAPSVTGLHRVTDALGAPAVAFYLPSLTNPTTETERLREFLLQAVTPCYLAGPGARDWSGFSAPLPLLTLPEHPLPAADTLSRILLASTPSH